METIVRHIALDVIARVLGELCTQVSVSGRIRSATRNDG